jgi:hypothetical protein
MVRHRQVQDLIRHKSTIKCLAEVLQLQQIITEVNSNKCHRKELDKIITMALNQTEETKDTKTTTCLFKQIIIMAEFKITHQINIIIHQINTVKIITCLDQVSHLFSNFKLIIFNYFYFLYKRNETR